MRRIYIDTSVVVAKLFGQKGDFLRHTAASKVFELISAKKVIGVISFYVLHEIYWFCMDNFGVEEAKEKARLALLNLLEIEIELAPLLSRSDRIHYSRRFPIRDSSDQAHAISAFVNNCDAIAAYDERFRDISHVIEYLKLLQEEKQEITSVTEKNVIERLTEKQIFIPPIAQKKQRVRHTPIKVGGKPLSEIIIEDRSTKKKYYEKI